MSKGYTLNYFINIFTNATVAQVNNNGPYVTVSPRFGGTSEKSFALDVWLNEQTASIFSGQGRFATYGKTPRARLLKALRNRKNNGVV